MNWTWGDTLFWSIVLYLILGIIIASFVLWKNPPPRLRLDQNVKWFFLIMLVWPALIMESKR